LGCPKIVLLLVFLLFLFVVYCGLFDFLFANCSFNSCLFFDGLLYSLVRVIC